MTVRNDEGVSRNVVQLVFRRFLREYLWLIALGGVAVVTLVVLSAVFVETSFLYLALAFMKHFYGGLIVGFLIHELIHAILISKTMLVLRKIEVSSKFARFSITADGITTGKGIFVTAIGGPLITATIGGIGAIICPQSQFFVWYLLHLIFLLPLFGDGRAALSGIHFWKKTVEISGKFYR